MAKKLVESERREQHRLLVKECINREPFSVSRSSPSCNYIPLLRTIHSTDHVLDNQKNRVYGNETHLLDEQFRFGSADLLTLVNGEMPPADEVIQRIKH